MSTTTMSVESRRSVLGRVFEVLDCFDRTVPEQSVSSVCSRTGLPPATVHRLLASLVEWGAVERTGRGCYRLGTHLWSLGHRVPSVRQLRDVARPHLVDLQAALHIPAMLAGAEDDRVVLIDSIAGRSASGLWPHDHAPSLQDHPAGWVLRAYASAYESAPVDLADRHEMAQIRANGCAVGAAAGRPALTWVAAPIVTLDRHVGSVLTVPVPGDGAPRPLLDIVRRAAHELSADLQAAQRRDGGTD